jgi:hypothetical protein
MPFCFSRASGWFFQTSWPDPILMSIWMGTAWTMSLNKLYSNVSNLASGYIRMSVTVCPLSLRPVNLIRSQWRRMEPSMDRFSPWHCRKEVELGSKSTSIICGRTTAVALGTVLTRSMFQRCWLRILLMLARIPGEPFTGTLRLMKERSVT